MCYPDFLQASIAMFSQRLPDCPSSHSISKACPFVTHGHRTGEVLVTVFPSHNCRSFGCHILLCLAAGRPGRSCAEVRELDLASHTGLEEEVEQLHPVLSRRDLGRTGDCCG